MKENIVVLDLETTGLNVSRAEIIEFGAWRIEKGQIVTKLQFLVRPQTCVAPKILSLTGINHEQLDNASSLEFYREDILGILRDATLVGHNVMFDLKLLENCLGIQISQPVWDTLELTRVFFPTCGRYSLSSIIPRLGLEEEIRRELTELEVSPAQLYHRALSDAWCSWRILDKCYQKALSYDLSFFDRAQVFLEGWPGRGFFDSLRLEVGRSFPERPIRTDLPFNGFSGELFQGAQEKIPPEPEWVVECLAPGGLLEQRLPGYETRAGQVRMAETVIEGLSTKQHRVIEAGTGTGKSLAYLVPSIWWARKTGKKVVVATHTIPLQEQLQKKDLPLLSEVLPFKFSAVVLKGKSNYLCPKKWHVFLANHPNLTPEESLASLGLLVWARETRTGDVQELAQLPGISGLWPKISAENEDCTMTCSQAKTCFLLASRRQAEDADLLIVNHSLLFSDIKTDFKVLPEYDYLIVDEAHHLHQSALEQLGFSVSCERVARMLDRIYRPHGVSFYTGISSRKGQLAAAVPGVAWDSFAGHLAEVPRLCAAVLDQTRELFQFLEDLSGEHQTIRLTKLHTSLDFWPVLTTQVENLASRVQKLQQQLEAMKGVLAGEEAEEVGGVRRDIAGYQRELEELREGILKSLEVEDYHRVTWLEKGYSLYLKTSPVEVSGVLREKIFTKLDCAVLTSATVSIGGKFEHFLQEIGLPANTGTCQVESPFDFENQMQFLVVKDLWQSRDSEQVLAEQVANFVAEIAESMKGRTLVLFTSHRLLRLTQVSLAKQLAPLQIEVLAQGVDGGRRLVLEEFIHNPRTVLLGASSFWEGIDIPGDALSCVIMVKLPFWAPSMPLIEARSQLIELNGGNSFQDFLLPEAVIRFKQGFGRLIRSTEDRGVVILLDPRIIEKSYGRLFLSSIPLRTHIRGNRGEVIQHVQTWVDATVDTKVDTMVEATAETTQELLF